MTSELKPLTDEEIYAAVKEPSDCTKDFIMQQTMMRVKDPKKSLEFYSKVLGMRLLTMIHFPSMKFSLYYMGYADPKEIPSDEGERCKWAFTRTGNLEFHHNWGSENDDTVSYHDGNSGPQGIGHIGISVPDSYEACKRFEKFGVEFVKKPDEGEMKGVAYIKDPDGYWIEILIPPPS